jgi:hypothetical protein
MAERRTLNPQVRGPTPWRRTRWDIGEQANPPDSDSGASRFEAWCPSDALVAQQVKSAALVKQRHPFDPGQGLGTCSYSKRQRGRPEVPDAAGSTPAERTKRHATARTRGRISASSRAASRAVSGRRSSAGMSVCMVGRRSPVRNRAVAPGGCSSAGRASPRHGEGHGFEARHPLHALVV